ncbi:MAG: glycosyltransferase family 2 protein [Sedimentisphaerales bacterium]|nr:glycosyltransferase family 2 protein [Sedimentisphaerales bacterium]
MTKAEKDDGRPELSVVVPLLDEQDNLRPLYEQITQALEGRHSYECIFIDDGSTDGSFSVLRQLHDSDQRVRVIRFRKNFGQTAALSAGFARARGDVVVALDADLQNDPADIPMLVSKLEEGYDVVSGWRRKRHDKALTRRLPSRIANWLISRVTEVRLHDYGCTLKAYRREVLDQIGLYGEMHRFIPALASWSGARIAECEVNHRPRTAGKAKYGLGRTLKVVLDLMTVKFLGSFSTKPIYVFGGLGLFTALMAILCGWLVVFQKLANGTDMSGNPLLLLSAVLFITTVQFILMGLLAELLVRTYHESQNRPTYVIKEVLGDSDFGWRPRIGGRGDMISDRGSKNRGSTRPRPAVGDKE